MLNIAFLFGNLTVGGSETKFIRMANRLAKMGHRIHVVALGKPHTLRYEVSDDVFLVCLDPRAKFSLANFLELHRYIRRENVGKIVCINPNPLIYGWPLSILNRDRGIACIASINTSDFRSRRDSFFMFLYGFMLRRCSAVIFGAKSQAEKWKSRYRIDSNKTTVIYNGVDIRSYQDTRVDVSHIRNSLSMPGNSRIIGCVAQLRPEKSHATLLEAFAILCNAGHENLALLLVGDGPERDLIQTLATRLGVSDYIYFAGQVKDVRPFLALMDVFVLASTSVEVFSNAVLEAMAMKVPVVISDIGGAKEMIEHEKHGLVFPKGDSSALARQLAKVLREKQMADSMCHRAQLRLQAEFSIEQMDKQYLNLFESKAAELGRGNSGELN